MEKKFELLTSMDLEPIQWPNGEDPCKGLFFKSFRSVFWTGERLEERKGYRFLKRMSCPGCSQCQAIIDDMREGMDNWREWGIPEDEFYPGRIYEAHIVVTSTDWESGYADDWEVQFRRVKENDATTPGVSG